MRSKRILWIFIGVGVLSLAELSWWITFQVQQASEQLTMRLVEFDYHRRMAQSQLDFGRRANIDETALTQLIEAHFPSLKYTPPHTLEVRPDLIESLRLKQRARLRMFLSEGAVFFVMVVSGLGLIFKTMKREVELSRQQANFLSAVTHELKSPLASIRLMAETLQVRKLDENKEQHYLKAIGADVLRLENLVSNILTVARLDAGRVVLHVEEFELNAWLKHALAGFSEQFRQRDFEPKLELSETPLFISADPSALSTVVRNLIDNALKYGGAKKPIAFKTRRAHDRILCEIIDHGIGLSSDDEMRIFEKFYRVGDEMVRQQEGTGLGLYLAKLMVQQMGGELAATSPGTNQGTTMTLTFKTSVPS